MGPVLCVRGTAGPVTSLYEGWQRGCGWLRFQVANPLSNTHTHAHTHTRTHDVARGPAPQSRGIWSSAQHEQERTKRATSPKIEAMTFVNCPELQYQQAGIIPISPPLEMDDHARPTRRRFPRFWVQPWVSSGTETSGRRPPSRRRRWA